MTCSNCYGDIPQDQPILPVSGGYVCSTSCQAEFNGTTEETLERDIFTAPSIFQPTEGHE